MAISKNYTPDNTMRTLFLRITAVNSTSSGEVSYTLEQIRAATTAFADRYADAQYAIIAHDKDHTPDGAVALHFHVFMRFAKPVKFKYIKEVFPFGSIQTCRSSNACMQYLIHQNNAEKHQYEKNAIHTNIPCSSFEAYFVNDKKLAKVQESDEIDGIIEQIGNGTISPFNAVEQINIKLYSKYEKRIESAFKHRTKSILLDPNRNIEVWFFTGAAGVGKTTLAKMYALANGNGVCVSSSSNDPLQDYRGEDTLILDDLRDDVFSFADLLKTLDNHTHSSVKSRYNNKYFTGKRIIITSYKPIENWYANVLPKAREQLYRRISCVTTITPNEIATYDRKTGETTVIANTVLKKVQALSQQKKIAFSGAELTAKFAEILENDLPLEGTNAIKETIEIADDKL